MTPRILLPFLALAVIVLPGCRAVTTIAGVKEPDLACLRQAEARAQVEKQLGKPAWSPGSANGLTYDIYQFPVAQPPRKAFGTMGLALDVLSLGLLEADTADLKQFREVKQLAVAYDSQDQVRSVSAEWLVVAPGPARRMRCELPAAAGVPATARPAPSAAPAAEGTPPAVLKWTRSFKIRIDGDDRKGGSTRVEPGTHTLGYRFGTGILDAFSREPYQDVSVEFLPGRTYALTNKRLVSGYHTAQTFCWIEDVGSNEVLWCGQP